MKTTETYYQVLLGKDLTSPVLMGEYCTYDSAVSAIGYFKKPTACSDVRIRLYEVKPVYTVVVVTREVLPF